ncbi:hypothetical protein EOA75_31375 [Mesorhizobium sp. M1A.F.Ca.IN.022.07.1.1]|nr:hypothetical protein EOA75_31375 [Mesorhizobium sp. M1A.F.Ca.IN.022.07.1.1]
MMVSVGLGRASRGLTAIPFHAAGGRNRGARAAAQRSAGRRRKGFLIREECRAAFQARQGKKPD